MLKFLGSGSAFNTKLGNNSAYYKEGNQMLLIDCGSNIFQRIKENNVLNGIEHIHVLVTHTHADHVGSLADLILYTYYSHGEFAKSKVTVYYANEVGVDDLLELNGCEEYTHYTSYWTEPYGSTVIQGFEEVSIIPLKTSHVKELVSYGYDMIINDTALYYSGDTYKIDKVDLNNLKNYDYFFIDTCKADYNGNVHLSLRKLTELIKPEYRHKVWCMHLDEGFIREEAEQLGFNVVTNEFK